MGGPDGWSPPRKGNRIRLIGRLIRPFRGTMAAYEALRRAPELPLDCARIRRAHNVRAGAPHGSLAASGPLFAVAYRRPLRALRHHRSRRIERPGPGGAHRVPLWRRLRGALRHCRCGGVRGPRFCGGGRIAGARPDDLPARRARAPAPGGAVGGLRFVASRRGPARSALDIRAGRARRSRFGARRARAGALRGAAGLRGRAQRHAGRVSAPVDCAAGGGGAATAAVLVAQARDQPAPAVCARGRRRRHVRAGHRAAPPGHGLQLGNLTAHRHGRGADDGRRRGGLPAHVGPGG